MLRDLGQNLTTAGLQLLGRFSRSPLNQDDNFRKMTGQVLFEATRAGFRLATAASRPFQQAAKLTKPARLPSAKPKDLFDLSPTGEQAMIRDEMQKFATERLRPAAHKADERCEADEALLAESFELGTAYLNIPEELGGAATERSTVTQVLVAEALSHGDMGLAVACLAPAGFAAAVAEWGGPEQQAAYLPPFVSEKPPVAAIAILEPHALFDATSLRTEATSSGSGYVLNGVKAMVPQASRCELFLVAAQTSAGPTMFIVEASTPGLRIEADPGMGLRGAGMGRLILENVNVPASAKLNGDGFRYEDLVNRSRLGWCALSVGTAQAVLDYVIPYVNDRTAFGEPVSHRQSVAFMVSNIGIELEGMRLMTWRAAGRVERGDSFAREVALARQTCAEHGMRIGSDGVQLLGGHGYTKEHPMERWYRDLRAISLMDGGVLV